MFKIKSKTQKPYIVLLGDVGAGKSKIVEKLTGAKGRSSAAETSVTVTSDIFEMYDGSLTVCDTPGSNAMEDQFQHNLHIAHAMNYKPVTCVMIVVKADTRMENVIATVREYAERFLPEEFPIELIGVCVTHMDTVKWTKEKVLPHLKGKLGIETAVFSSLNTKGTTLRDDILAECAGKESANLRIDGEMFLKLFKISDDSLKILRETTKEVSRFEKMKQDFYKENASYKDKNSRMDMIFEFQSWMLQEIIEAQKRLSKNNKFTFEEGPEMASEAGHVANMTNQLRKVLSDVRIEAMTYHKDVDTDFRKCPHCSTVWQKIEGCDGPTTCGNRVTENLCDDWSISNGVMSTFKFIWDVTQRKLIIEKLSSSKKKEVNTSKKPVKVAGCGKEIEWSKMAPVKVPVEFDISPSSTKDIIPIQNYVRAGWNAAYDKAIKLLPKLKVNKIKGKPEE